MGKWAVNTASEENREENGPISLIVDIVGDSCLRRVLLPRGPDREIPGPVGCAVLGLMRHFTGIVSGGVDWLRECGLMASSELL